MTTEGRCNDRLKAFLCRFDGVNAGIDNGSHHKRFDLPALVLQDSVCALLRPFQGSIWIGFPEVDARTEPVVIVLAEAKRLVCKQTLACIPIAAVIPQNEGGGKAMHLGDRAW